MRRPRLHPSEAALAVVFLFFTVSVVYVVSVVFTVFTALPVSVLAAPGALQPARSSETPSPTLEVLATTMTQIVLQWETPSQDAYQLVLERATSKDFTQGYKSYSLAREIRVFSDTDREPVSKHRFVGDKTGPHLDPAQEYFYRIKCSTGNNAPQYSNTASARLSKPVRGKEGDLWADVVLGASCFGENVNHHPTKDNVYYPGGVLIDKTANPNRMYIADCNNNRILGFKSTSPDRGADLVLGQPDFESSTGNGDSCAQLFPYRHPASASSLCLTNPIQISIGETIVKANMAVDDRGNLYVPDTFNNRILKYNNPFNSDSIADEVWGQADFSGNEPNRGSAEPASNTLHLTEHGSVTLDSAGNLWVADYANSRVLRFPKNAATGVIAAEADVVLGQPNFNSRAEHGYKRTMDQMWFPSDVEFDARGRLYVCDGISNAYDGRVLVFEPPFRSGMAAARKIPIPNDTDVNKEFGEYANTTLGSIVRDVHPGRMWFEESTFASKLLDLETGKAVTSVWCYQSSGIDVDSQGNLYTVGKWSGVFRYPSTSWGLTWSQRKQLVENVFPGGNRPTAGSTGGILGITTFKDQLIIAENSRLLIWNQFSLDRMENGHPADDFFGEKDFSTIAFQHYISSCQTDRSGRLWISDRVKGMHSTAHHVLEAFAYPMARASRPVKTVPLMNGEDNVLPVLGGGGTHTAAADFIDFAVSGSGDKIWVADRNASRVFRINNVDGIEDLKGGHYVDIVLGQNSLAGAERNLGKDQVGPRGLASAYNVDISPRGELLIADNGGEVGSNRRILIYRPERFPVRPAKCLFADDIGDPDRVLGTGGKFDISGLDSPDPICSPFEVGTDRRGAVVAGMNGYSAQRFPLVYLDPSRTPQSQMALGDFTAYPTTCFIDDDGNVYVGDFDWSRVLIYKKPFARIRY